MSNQQMACSDDQLIMMLRSNEAELSPPLLEHIETCSRCQDRLSELAATEANWKRAAAVLADDSLEHGGGESDFTAAAKLNRWSNRPVAWTESMVKHLLQPPTHPEMLGRLGRYEIERLIGSGGMGVVFKAHDTELNRPVAVKLLAPYLASSGSARNRFAREARSAAGVVDDHVVPIFNVESENDPPFLVMQYVAGGSLQEKLDRDGPLEVAEALRIGLQTAKGLAAAHAQGLIHRDVKPSNILLDEGVERAMLTDFGLARAENDASLTRSGFHPGTPHYMSPEQIRGESIDGRSDLFGLGCVLYAACACHPPFRAETSYAVLRRITDESPRPLREVNVDVPEWLEMIVMKLLAKSAENRIQSAEEVAELLEACLAHVQQPTVVPLPESVTELAKSFGSDDDDSRPTESLGGFRYPPVRKLIAGAFLSFLLLAGIFITLETSKGTIKIESEADNVPIVIKKEGKVYDRLTVNRDGCSIRVYAGEYEITFDGEPKSMEIDKGTIALGWGDDQVVRIREEGRIGSDIAVSRSKLLTPEEAIEKGLLVVPRSTPATGQRDAHQSTEETVQLLVRGDDADKQKYAAGDRIDVYVLASGESKPAANDTPVLENVVVESCGRGNAKDDHGQVSWSGQSIVVKAPADAGLLATENELLQDLYRQGKIRFYVCLHDGSKTGLAEASPYRKSPVVTLPEKALLGKWWITGIDRSQGVKPGGNVLGDGRDRAELTFHADGRLQFLRSDGKTKSWRYGMDDKNLMFISGDDEVEAPFTRVFRWVKLPEGHVMLVLPAVDDKSTRREFLLQQLAEPSTSPNRSSVITDPLPPGILRHVTPQRITGVWRALNGSDLWMWFDEDGSFKIKNRAPNAVENTLSGKWTLNERRLTTNITSGDMQNVEPWRPVQVSSVCALDDRRLVIRIPNQKKPMVLFRQSPVTNDESQAEKQSDQEAGDAHSIREIFAPIDGKVVQVVVDTSDRVSKGDILLRLRNIELETERYEIAHQLQSLAAEVESGTPSVKQTQQLETLSKKKRELDKTLQTLLIRSPVDGVVMTRKLKQMLKDRSVKAGHVLLTIDTKGNHAATDSKHLPHFRVSGVDEQLERKLLQTAEAFWDDLLVGWDAGDFDVAGETISIKVNLNDKPMEGHCVFTRDKTNPEIHIAGSAEAVATALPRYISHAFLARLTGGPLTERWFWLGTGQLTESEQERAKHWAELQVLRKAEELLPLADMLAIRQLPSDEKDRQRLCAQSMVFCQFIIDTNGRTALLKLAKQPPDAEAIKSLEQQFVTWLANGSRQAESAAQQLPAVQDVFFIKSAITKRLRDTVEFTAEFDMADELKPQMILPVHRGDSQIGQIQITALDEEQVYARIIDEKKETPIQAGDVAYFGITTPKGKNPFHSKMLERQSSKSQAEDSKPHGNDSSQLQRANDELSALRKRLNLIDVTDTNQMAARRLPSSGRFVNHWKVRVPNPNSKRLYVNCGTKSLEEIRDPNEPNCRSFELTTDPDTNEGYVQLRFVDEPNAPDFGSLSVQTDVSISQIDLKPEVLALFTADRPAGSSSVSDYPTVVQSDSLLTLYWSESKSGPQASFCLWIDDAREQSP